jgi:hypothetical protein
MTNFTMQQKSNNELMSSFPSEEVKKYIGINDGFPTGNSSRWLLDSFQLINTNWPDTYGDYSFIVVPASKALENWIFMLAKDLDINVNTDRAQTVRDQIESHLNTALDGVEKKMGESIKIDISYLRNFIQEYRNDIVHCGKKIENATLAKSKVFVIYERINTVTEKLIQSKLIKP